MTTYEKIKLEKNGIDFDIVAQLKIKEEDVLEIVKERLDKDDISELFFQNLSNLRQTEILEEIFINYLNDILEKYIGSTLEHFKNIKDEGYEKEKHFFNTVIDKNMYGENDFDFIYSIYKSLKEMFENRDKNDYI